jgi:hypothetical protein
MVLTEEQIKEKIKKPEALDDIAKASKLHSNLQLHVNGKGYETKWLKNKADGFESNNTLKKKQHYCRPKTPRIYQGVTKQYAKIFRAKGNTRLYQFKDERKQLESEFKKILGDCSFGLSIQQFMQVIWFRAFIEEPNGFVAVELKPADQLKDPNKEEPYVTFYCMDDIHDYEYINNELQYIILKSEVYQNDQKYDAFRVIDSETDSLWYKDGDEIKPVIITEKTQVEQEGEVYVSRPDSYPMKFKKIPFIQVSNYRASATEDNYKINPLTRSLPNADSYLSLSDDHTICVKLHQHPIMYSYPLTCVTCNGLKTLKRPLDSNRDEYEYFDCTTCNGTGHMSAFKADLSQGISLPVTDNMEENGFPAAQAPAGYITPELESLKEQRIEMKDEQDFIEYACLGVVGILARDTQTQVTATKAELDMQPLIDTLSEISANAEQVEKYLTDRIGEVLYQDAYVGSSIHYGRLYFLKSIETLYLEYDAAKKSGATEGQLKEILRTINYIKFENDALAELRAQMLLDLEPMPTKTIAEVVLFKDAIDQATYNLKANFLDLVNKFENEFGNIVYYKSEQENLTYLKRVEEIKSILIKYAEQIRPISISPDNGQQGQLN